MKKPLLTAIIFLSFFVLITAVGCKKTPATPNSAPSVLTQDVMLDVTSTSAQSGGTITSVGTSSISANGVVYSSTDKVPTLADDKTTDPVISVSYTYTSNIAGLTPSTTYYLRAYATNQFGTGYGAVVTFTTAATLSSVFGTVTTFAGTGASGYADGAKESAEFSNPTGMVVDAQGNIYISDSFNNRIRKIATDGTVSTLAGNGIAGYVDSKDGEPEFYGPQGLAIDGAGNIYVADFGNNVIRKITPSGTVSTYAGNGVAAFVDGAALKVAAFNGPAGLAFDTHGNLFVADQNNNMIRKISAAGGVSLIAGTPRAGHVNLTVDSAAGAWGAFNKPVALAVDPSGNLYVADKNNSAIRQITPAGVITTIAGGPKQQALIGYPAGICVDASGNSFITDQAGRIIELTSAKTLYILAGASNVSGFADGSGTAAQFSAPQGICVDAGGNIYVADFNNNRIRKVVVVANN
ncbi:MAG: SMP-30/gluconolactonase/LRE family protein [Mucilaginibacter sp.]